MPIYEYLCSECGHSCDILQKISDSLKTECPECHKNGLKKQVSAPSFQLKGTGWYVTDFKDKGKDKNKTEPKPKTKVNTKDTPKTSTDSKPEKSKKTTDK